MRFIHRSNDVTVRLNALFPFPLNQIKLHPLVNLPHKA